MSKKQEVAVITPEEQAYIDSLHHNSGSYGPGFDKLDFIIKLMKDESGKKIMPGQFKLGDKIVEDIKFRPVRVFNQLIKSVQKPDNSFEVISQSIYFKDYSEELLDSAGGIACGRKFGKDTKGFSEEEAKANKDIATVYLFVFGFATIGDEVIPAYMRLRGGKFYSFTTGLRAIPQDKVMGQYNFDLKLLEVDMPDGTLGYNLEVVPDLTNVLPISPILQFDREVQEWILGENKKILEKHLQANKYANKDVSNAASIADHVANMVDVTPNGLEDELPF